MKLYAPFILGLASLLAVCQAANAQQPKPVDFGRDIRPILAKSCFKCHGPDKNEGGLRLNSKDAAFAETDSGDHAIVPGKVEKSVLIERIISLDEDLRMPPEGKPLSKTQADLFRRWISEGALWKGHWAYEAVKHPIAPKVKNQSWVRNPIDAFILRDLEKNGLIPAAEADKITLIRRASYDLTGLPPTIEEVKTFAEDTSPQAYEKLIDRLLRSSHYGERWARHWLDLVRFAETNSYERDGVKRHAWRYRDYVIRSLNDDKPYDQFIREQLAGDELPKVTADSIIATGYYRLGIWDDEPTDRLQARYDGLNEILSTTSQVFLGLTIGCARCHDHKIDPIPQKDYYQMLSFFHNITPMSNGGANIQRRITPAGNAPFEQRNRELAESKNLVQAQLTKLENDFRIAYKKQADPSAGKLVQTDLDDLSYRFYRDSWQQLPTFSEIKHETEGQLPKQLFDISPATRREFFGFVFNGILKVPVDGEYTFFLDSDDGSRLLVDGKTIAEIDGIHGVGNVQRAKVRLKKGRSPIKLEYFQAHSGLGLHVGWSGPGFDRRSLSATQKNKTPNITDLFNRHGEKLLGKVRFAEYRNLKKQLDRLKQTKIKTEIALCVTEHGRKAPETFVLLRGSAHAKGEKVEPGFLSILNPPQPTIPEMAAGVKSSGRRLALANWIASPENQMTTRVMANRIWQFHFGRGIVRSSNNFGGLGIAPTHPELLDWLASRFVAGRWRMKAMHKLIMMSSTYRMSSRGHEADLAKDPTNNLFWRFNMRRLSAEELRDSVHAVNGSFNPQMFGPGFYPQISREVLQGQSRPGAGWGKSSIEQQSRRSIYIHVKRSLLTPILSSFDFPDPDGSCAARFVTTGPTQALGMLNGKFLNDQAAVFAARLRKEAGAKITDQVRLALQLAASRKPDQASVAAGVKLIESLSAQDDITPEKALDYYCLFVLNLNEFVYLD